MAAPDYNVPANVAEVLQNTAKKYRQELLTMPVKALTPLLQHFQLRPGIRVSETVGELLADAEYGPYDEKYKSEAGIEVAPRVLEVFFGNVEFDFSPNSVYSTVWGSNITMGEALKNVPIALQVLSYVALKLGGNLGKHLFDAVRDASKHKSKDLFNGFDTIAAAEVAGGGLSAANGNYMEIPAITENNALEVIQSICESADELLMDLDLKLYVPRSVGWKFNKSCLLTLGAVPYNKEYKKTFVPGFENVEIVPLGCKAGSQYIQLSPRSNMLIGVNQVPGSKETVEVNRFSSFTLTYAATTFFGTQYESINKEKLMVAKVASQSESDGGESNGGGGNGGESNGGGGNGGESNGGGGNGGEG